MSVSFGSLGLGVPPDLGEIVDPVVVGVLEEPPVAVTLLWIHRIATRRGDPELSALEGLGREVRTRHLDTSEQARDLHLQDRVARSGIGIGVLTEVPAIQIECATGWTVVFNIMLNSYAVTPLHQRTTS